MTNLSNINIVDDYEEAAQAVSTWVNNNDAPAVLLLLTEKVRPVKTDPNNKVVIRTKVVINPGQEVTLPSSFDGQIHIVDQNGVIMGGQCPWLVKKGQDLRMHSSLDYKAVQHDLDVRSLTSKIKDEASLREAVKLLSNIEDATVAPKKVGRPAGK